MASVYDVAIRLSLETAGLQRGAQLAMGVFGGLEKGARAAEQRAALLGRTFSNIDWSAPGASSFGASLAGQFGIASAAAEEANAKVTKFNTSMGMVAAGGAITVAGFVMGDLLEKAAARAGDLQVAMTGVQLATGATTAQMAALHTTLVAIGLRNQMSVTDAARVALAETHAGITDPAQLQATVRSIANFAEVQHIQKGTNRTESATTAVEYAHLFGAYTPQLLNPLVNVFSKALTHTPVTAPEFVTMVSQFAGATRGLYGTGTGNKLRLESDDTLMGVLLGQLGQASRGGTQFSSALMRLASAKLGTAAYRGEQKIEQAGGGSIFNRDGTFVGDKAFLGILQTAARTIGNPLKMASINKDAFGTVGGRLMGLLEDPSAGQRWTQNQATFNRLPSLDQQQAAYNATAEGQSQQWHKNVSTIVTDFGTYLLPALTMVRQALVGITGTIAQFVAAHPRVLQIAAGFALLATATALIVGPIVAAAGAFSILSLALVPLGIELLPLTGIVLGVIAAIAGVTLIVMHWSQITDFARNHTLALVAAVGFLVPGLAIIASSFGVISAIGGAVAAVFGVISGAVMTLSAGFGVAALTGGLLDLALSPVTLIILAVGAAVAGVVLLITHWSQVTTFVAQNIRVLGPILAGFIAPLAPLIAGVTAIVALFIHWHDITVLVGQMMGWLGDKLHGFLVTLGLATNAPAATQAVAGAASVHVGSPVLGGTTVGLPATIPPVHLPPVPVSRKIGGLALIGQPLQQHTHHQTLHIHPGAIAIHPLPHHSIDDIAEAVSERISKQANWDAHYTGGSTQGLEPGPYGW